MNDPQTRTPRIVPVALAALMVVMTFSPLAVAQVPLAAPPSAPSSPPNSQASPGIVFEKNMGQWDSTVLFRVTGEHDIFITKTGMVLVQTERPASTGPKHLAVAPAEEVSHWATVMTLVGSNPSPIVATDAPTPYYTNYFIGSDPMQWHSYVPTYRHVTLTNVYPGIDLVYYAAVDGGLKYDFIVRPGADASQIQQRYEGANRITTDASGALLIETGLGLIKQGAPVTHQANGAPVTNRYTINGATVTYAVGVHDAAQDLIIDPLVYSTFLRGCGCTASALDSSGNTYVTGESGGSFPTTSGAYKTTYDNVAVAKLDPTGSTLLFSTFFGGSGSESPKAIRVDGSGNTYITGWTTSTNLPTTVLAYQTSNGGSYDAFVTKFDAAGASLLYSTYLGGSGIDAGVGLALDSSGNAYIGGETDSSAFPLASAYQSTYGGSTDAFVTKLNAAGTGLLYSTYLGGSSMDRGHAITVDASGNAYLAGDSGNFPTSAGAYQTGSGGFVAKLNALGSRVYATAINDASLLYGIAVDSIGNAHVTGYGAYGSIVVVKLNSAGTSALFSNYYSDSGAIGFGITVDSTGYVYVVGSDQGGFTTTSGAYQTTFGGSTDGFLLRLDSSGTAIYATFLGGSSIDETWGINVDSSGMAYVVGDTLSSNYPTTSASYQPTYQGGSSGFITKLAPALVPGTPTGLGSSCGSPHGVALSWTAPSSNGGAPVSSYGIYRSSNGGTTFTSAGVSATTSYTDTPPWQTGSYVYRVTANNIAGESPASATTSFAPCDSQAPTVTGNPKTVPWTNSALLTGVTWHDAYSGLQSAEYSVGTTSGGTNVVGWSSSLPQPPSGAADWTPSAWSPSGIAQGINYVNVRVTDRAGNTLTTNGAYVVQFDSVVATVTGAPKVITWQNAMPTLTGVTWQDSPHSGLKNNVQYSVGTSSGATNVLGWTSLAAQHQPVNGQTSAWTPSWSPAMLAQGQNYVNMRVSDVAENVLTTNGAYTVQFDTVVPLSLISSSSHPDQAKYYQGTAAALSWTTTEASSGVAGYYVRAPATGTCPTSLVGSGTWQTAASSSPGGLGPFAQYWFCVQPKDVAGNVGPVASFEVNVNTIPPGFQSAVPNDGRTVANPKEMVRVDFDNKKGGADLSEIVRVNPALVSLFVDGTDVVEQYRNAPECTPVNGQVPPTCPVRVDSGHVEYTPPTAWEQGLHELSVAVGDTTVPPLTAGMSWSFTMETACEAPQVGVWPDCHTAGPCGEGFGVQVDDSPTCIGSAQVPTAIESCAVYNALNSPQPYPNQNTGLVIEFDPAGPEGDVALCAGTVTGAPCPAGDPGVVVNNDEACAPQACPVPTLGVQPDCHTVELCSSGVGIQVDGTGVCQPLPVPCDLPSVGVQPFCFTPGTCDPPESVGATVNGMGACVVPCPAPSIGIEPGCHTVEPCDSGVGVVIDDSPTCQPMPVPCTLPSVGIEPFCVTVSICDPPGSIGAMVNGIGECVPNPGVCNPTPGPYWSFGVGTACLGLPWVAVGGNPNCPGFATVNLRIYWGTTPGPFAGTTLDVCF